MADWRILKKVDAHIHILPDAVHEANPDSDDVWVYADLHKYHLMMDALNIEKAAVSFHLCRNAIFLCNIEKILNT